MSRSKKAKEKPALLLSEISDALAEIDKQRKSELLNRDEREILEMAAVALRDSERLLIANLQKAVIKEMESTTATLSSLSKEIRAKVEKMNKLPKAIDGIEGVIKVVVRILGGVVKWLN